jgi:hypothetical protein
MRHAEIVVVGLVVAVGGLVVAVAGLSALAACRCPTRSFVLVLGGALQGYWPPQSKATTSPARLAAARRGGRPGAGTPGRLATRPRRYLGSSRAAVP